MLKEAVSLGLMATTPIAEATIHPPGQLLYEHLITMTEVLRIEVRKEVLYEGSLRITE
jgi:hypothetical protein